MIATMDDVEQVIVLYRKLLEDLSIPEILRTYIIEEDKLRNILLRNMANDDGWFIRPLRRNNRIVGIFAGMRVFDFLANEHTAQEILAWVEPESRNISTTREGVSIVRQFEDWARRNNCTRIRFNTYGDYVRQLEALGYVQSTVVLQKRLT